MRYGRQLSDVARPGPGIECFGCGGNLGILGESEMPIKAILQSIDGTLRIGSVVDAYGGLNRCLPFGSPDAEQNTFEVFPLFQQIDAYCDVVFKQAQLPQL